MAGILRRILVLFGTILMLGIALWASVTIVAILMIVGGIAILVYAARQFLTSKGILNPRPGVPMEESPADITVIEGEFEQVENPMIRESEKTRD